MFSTVVLLGASINIKKTFGGSDYNMKNNADGKLGRGCYLAGSRLAIHLYFLLYPTKAESSIV